MLGTWLAVDKLALGRGERFEVPGRDYTSWRTVSRPHLWRCVFPPSTPLAELDVDRLASLNVTGGTIRNIALNAAVLAADEGVSLGMQHLASAAQTEFEKLKLPQPGLTR